MAKAYSADMRLRVIGRVDFKIAGNTDPLRGDIASNSDPF
jgi:hypothetical protein